jgi:DNA-binding NarL/FixJ family response regulator
MRNIRILVVDDHPVVRAGICALIATGGEMEVVAQVGSGEDAVQQYSRHLPDITLMDLRLPGIGGVEAIRRIRATDPKAGIIVLTTYEGDEDIYQAVEAGAAGYLIKDMPEDKLFNAIRRVHAGKRYLPPPVTEALNARVPDSALSKREHDVLELIAQGYSNQEIGQKLGISEGTAKWHVSIILGRLNAGDRTQAVVIAAKRGLIHL